MVRWDQIRLLNLNMLTVLFKPGVMDDSHKVTRQEGLVRLVLAVS